MFCKWRVLGLVFWLQRKIVLVTQDFKFKNFAEYHLNLHDNVFTPWNAFNNEPWKYLWRWFWRWHQRCWCWQGEVVELLEVLGWLQVLHGSPLVICQYPPQDTRETGAHIGLLSLHIAIIIIITRQGRSDKAPTLLLCAQLRVEATSPSKTNHPAIEGIF